MLFSGVSRQHIQHQQRRLTCSSPIEVFLAARAEHTITSSVLLNHQIAVGTTLAVFRLHQLERVLFWVGHSLVDLLGCMLGAREIFVPGYQTHRTGTEGACVASDLRISWRLRIWQTHSAAARRHTSDWLDQSIMLPDVEHLHVEFFQCFSWHVPHDKVPAPMVRASWFNAADENLPGTQTVETGRHSPSDTCLADRVNLPSVRVPTKVRNTLQRHVPWLRPFATLVRNPSGELIGGLLFNTNAAREVSAAWWTRLGVRVRLALGSPWVCTCTAATSLWPGLDDSRWRRCLSASM
jgi:hypothetical protein